MLKRAISIALIFLSTATVNLPNAQSEVTPLAINQSDYLYQPIPAEMFLPQETLFGFGAMNPPAIGRVTTKGPDNVWTVVFQPCDAKIVEDCVESVSSRNMGSEKWVNGNPTLWKPASSDSNLSSVTYTQLGETQYQDYFIDSKTGYPRGGMAKVWNLPGAEHGGGSDYLLSIGVSYYKNENPTQINQSFGIRLTPVKLGEAPNASRDYFPFSYGKSYEFPSDREYRVKIRLGKFKNELGGWYNGKISDPKIDSRENTLTISGSPTKTLVARTGPISCENRKLNATATENCKTRANNFGSTYVGVATLNSSIENAIAPNAFYPSGSFAYFEPLLKPIGYKTDWLAGNWGINSSGTCSMAPNSVAIVTSNAGMYSAFPPAWDPIEKTLSYKVGSIHLDHTGSVHRGHFNLAVPTEFARCLWGSDILKAKASVSVTNSDGSSNVSTAVLTQDAEMVYFKVAGFTFSTPNIQVKLEVPLPSASTSPTPTPAATNKATSKKVQTICVKGKSVKKVDGTVCPKGYRKKA